MIIRGKQSKIKTDISNLQYWCQFIGSVRSGHTLVSQILNAHKDVLISDELGATNLFDGGIGRYEVFNAIRVKADRYFRGGNKTWKNRYTIGLYQNKTEKPTVIGDKICGADTTKFGNKQYLESYMSFIGLPFKFIWVLRDPVQHINGKVMLGRGAKNEKYYSVKSNILQYKSQYKIAKSVESKYDVMRVYLEDLIENPDEQIIRVLEWLNLCVDDKHINGCKKIIFDKPNIHSIAWSDEELNMISEEINDYNNNR